MRPRHTGFIVEKKEMIQEGNRKISVFYSIKTMSHTTIEVLPETLERMIKTAQLPDPKQLVEDAMKKVDLNDKEPTVRYDFLIDEDIQSYKVNIAVNVGMHTFLSIGTPKPLEDAELKTQLKYALKLRDLYRMIDDAFEVIELLRMNEWIEEDD